MGFGDTSLKYHVFKDYNLQFDEKMNKFGTLRRVQWVKEGSEPDEAKSKLELRKIKIDETGELTLKGYVFDTEEGPHELVEGMVDLGFGDTKKILRAVRKRDDFLEAANTINEDSDDSNEGELFDMRDLLSGMSDGEDIESD